MPEKRREETDAILSEGPPVEWYIGFGYQDRGIVSVTHNNSLEAMENGEVGKHLGEWRHYTGNPVTSGDSEERKKRAQSAIESANVFVQEITGFSPQEIVEKAHTLRNLFRGQKEAPFEIELY